MKRSKPKQERKPEAIAILKHDFLRVLEKNLGIVTSACRELDVPRRTHYYWVEQDPEYAAAVADIQDQALDMVESRLLKKVQDLDTTAIIFYLKTKGKGRGYIERVQTQEVKPEPFVVERETVIADQYTTTTT